MKISLICVYNSEEQLNNKLLASPALRDLNIEKVLLNNNKYKYKSAAEALNYGANLATGDILIFSHQDIYIKDADGIVDFCEMVGQLKVGDIVGTQGVREKSKTYYSNITAGEQLNKSIINNYPNSLMEVSCVDEGFFGMKKATWEKHPFDECLCSDWHLYAVEQALHARKNHNSVYVYPIQLHHFSYGTISLSYMNCLRKLCEKYRDDFKYIWTTCYKVNTGKWYINTLIFIWTLNRRIRRKTRGV